MQTITAPISPNEPRENRATIIANLQDALLFLIDKELIRFEGAELPIRVVELRQDRQRSEFGAGTRNVMMAFRREFQLGEGEIVDEPTAKELNRLLRQAGAFAEPQGEWVVLGQVVDVNGPINDIQVSVFDRDLFFGRDEADSGDTLGAGLTKNLLPKNEDGCFEFTYTTAVFAAGDIPGKDVTLPDLIFVLEQQGERLANFQIFRLPDGQILTEETLVAADDLIMGIQARKVEEVRIVITNRERKSGLSEYEQLWRGIEPLLPGRVPAGADDAQREATICAAARGFDQEQHKDISFIVRETGLSFELLMVFAAACKLSALSFRQDVPPVVLYGLARGGLMTDLHSLAKASAADLKRGLSRAMADNRIPRLSNDVIDGSIETILRLAPQALTGETPFAGQPAFGERISAALPNPDEQSTLLRTFAENNDDPKKFWQRLRDLPEFAEEGKVERVQFALQLDALTSSHVPLMRALQSEHGLKTTRELLDFDDAKLRELLLRPEIGVPVNVPGEGPQEKSDNYIQSVIGALHLALPTESVAKSLREADAVHVGDEVTQAALNTFFAKATTEARRNAGTHFDIRETNIDDYVTEHGAETLADVAGEVRDQVVIQLKRAQRLFQVSTSPEAFQVLVKSGLDSARDIASIPQQTFVAQYAGAGAAPVVMREAGAFNELDQNHALMIHARATTISTSATHLYVALNSALNELQPNAIKILDQDAQRGVGEIIGKHLPNWQGLFGAPEQCECGHCRSVYSPAAYLVDVLHFLEKSGRNAEGFTPLDYLIGKAPAAPGGKSVMGRRPDIALLKLTCEHSNTALPYVDLINEVLESLAIAYASGTEMQGSISVDYNAIATHDTGDATTAELRANPQYTNLSAYHTPDDPNARAQLDRVSYPLTLPYDHARETARVYLKHLGAELSELLETFGDPKNPVGLAAEILGLSPGQYEILTGQKLDGTVAELNQQVDELYGLTPELLPRLKTGDVGEFVAALKRKLNKNGAALVLAADPSIETFDAATEAAVRDLQVAQALDNDGIVKIGEWRALAALAPAVADTVLPNARQFLSRTGITYEELVYLCETHFINPEQEVFEILLRLRVPANELIAFVAADFQDPGADLIKALETAGVRVEDFGSWAGERLSSEAFKRLKASVVLDAPADDPCNLDHTRLRRWDAAEPDLDAATWRRLNQLIRLWRKLGWSLRDLDQALTALQTKEITPEVIVQLSVIKTVQQKLDLSISEVVALWSTLELIRRTRYFTNCSSAVRP
jgi:peptidoglycan hydrolase-like protein with peptidoglycan-binding domain